MRFTIVVADDEKNIREGLAEALSLEGYRAVPAADGEEALALVEANDADLVLTDLRMPRMGGTEVLKAGDSLAFPSDSPYAFANTGKGSLSFILNVVA